MSANDSEQDPPTRVRSKTAASLLSTVAPGLGYLYVGRFAAGLATNALFVGLLVLFVGLWTWLEFFPALPGAVFAIGWLVFTALVVSDVRRIVDERDDPYELQTYNHWTIYSGIYLVGYLLPIAAVLVYTGSVFWSVTTADARTMHPNVVPGDSVLIREHAYRDDPPRAGDLVALQFPGSDSYRILRVIAAGPTKVRMTGNDVEVGERRLPQIPLEATPAARSASASVGRSSTREGADEKGKAAGDELEGGTAAPPDDFELLVERNGARRYVVSLRPSATGKPSFETYELAKNELFLLADNRSAPEAGESEPIRDSRVFGPVDRSAISGRPLYIAWSTEPDSGEIRWNRIGLRLQ